MKAGYFLLLLAVFVCVNAQQQEDDPSVPPAEKSMKWRMKVLYDIGKKFVDAISDQLQRLAKNSKKSAKEYYGELKNLHEIKQTGDRERFRGALTDFLFKIKYDLITLNWPNMYLQLLKYWLTYVDDAHIESIVDQLAKWDIVRRSTTSMKEFVHGLDEKYHDFKLWVNQTADDAAYIFKPWGRVIKDLARLFIKEVGKAVGPAIALQGMGALEPYKETIGAATWKEVTDAVAKITGSQG